MCSQRGYHHCLYCSALHGHLLLSSSVVVLCDRYVLSYFSHTHFFLFHAITLFCGHIYIYLYMYVLYMACGPCALHQKHSNSICALPLLLLLSCTHPNTASCYTHGTFPVVMRGRREETADAFIVYYFNGQNIHFTLDTVYLSGSRQHGEQKVRYRALSYHAIRPLLSVDVPC